MDRRRIEERVKEYILLYEQIKHFRERIDELNSKIRKVESLLFGDRNKAYIEDVASFLSKKANDFKDEEAFNELVSKVNLWSQGYDDYIEVKRSQMSSEQLAIFEERIE
jgi:hypothetical protein